MNNIDVNKKMLQIPNVAGFNFTKTAYNEYIQSLPVTGSQLHQRGKSVDDEYDIFEMTYGDMQTKPTIQIVSGIHGGHEWHNAHIVRRFHELLNNPPNSAIQKIRDNFSFSTIPFANPWGYDNNSYENKNGVNLNRNLHSTTPQPEAQIVKDVVLRNKPILCIDLHTWGGYEYGWLYGIGTMSADYYQQLMGYALNNVSTMIDKRPRTISSASPANYGSVRSWSGEQKNDLGINTISVIVEAAEHESNTEKSRIVLNAIIGSVYTLALWMDDGSPGIWKDERRRISIPVMFG